jgi:DNA repair protein SbcD/Mre11
MHFADVHFGIETYGKIDPQTGLNTRLIDFRRSLECAVDKALDAGIHLALFAGDAYKSRDPNQTHQREFASCIRRLTEAGVPVVMVTGNHDLPNSKGRANAIEIYRTLGIQNVHIMSQPGILEVETSAGPVQIVGMPYLLRSNVLSRDECKNKSIQDTTDLMVQKYCTYIDYFAQKLQPNLPSVLLGHFWIKNAKVSSQTGYLNVAEPEVLVSAVASAAFDYVAMGHIHKFQDLNKRSSPPVVYCGSVDRIDFSEKGEDKGFVLVELAKGAASYEFVSIPARRFVEIDVDADVEDPTAKILAAIADRDVQDAVVKVLYHISQEKLPLVRESEIREALSPAFLVVSVTKDVQRDNQAVRNRLLNESLDPIQALEMFFDTKDDSRKRKSELMEYARPLIDELLAEEQVG